MQKGESIISIALTVLLVLVGLAIQRRWSSSTFRSIASSAEKFVLKKAGLRGNIPELPGDERVRTFRLGPYTAALYRASPAPLVYASYHFILFDHSGRSLFRADTIEASATPWTTLYDFAGRRGLVDRSKPGRSVYARDLTGDGFPDILLGQYSGGDHCCTSVTVIELGNDKAQVIGKVSGLYGLPFAGLEIHHLDRGRGWQLVAHRPYQTACGLHADAADVVTVYAFRDGQFTDQTPRFTPFLNRVLQSNLSQWKRRKNRSLRLLQSIAADYSLAGQPAAGQKFFQQNLTKFLPQLQAAGADPKACAEGVANLVNSLSPNSTN